jgi:lipopolysaccharide/colanic/teichoic acid biosynthesis glycosyltransferase
MAPPAGPYTSLTQLTIALWIAVGTWGELREDAPATRHKSPNTPALSIFLLVKEFVPKSYLEDFLPTSSIGNHVYPTRLFQMRLKEELLRSNRTGRSFLYVRIPTRHYDLFGFLRPGGNTIQAWKIAVLTLLTQTQFVDVVGYLEDDAGLGVVFLDCDHAFLETQRRAILRNLRDAGLLEKITLRPRTPLFEAFVCTGKPESEHITAEQAMARFNHINEGFFSLQPLLYSDILHNRWNHHLVNFVKRCIDIVGVSVGILLSSPILLACALAVKISDPRGPIIFKQTRVGLNGRRFTMYKFRSMYMNAEEIKESLQHLNETTGPVFKMKNDPRVYPAGRIMRKYSLDELPQLFNILFGHMSIVGPRPPVPKEVAEYLPWHRMRLSVKPGLTCHWQVSGRSNIGFEDWMRLDNQYVRHGDIKTDLSLISKTFKVVFKGEGAY